MSRRQGRHVGLRPRSPQGSSVRGDAMAASSHTPTIALGLIAAPGLATELASELADDLPAALAERVSAEVTWEVPVVSDPLAAEATPGTAMIDAGRERMVREGWDLAVVLTDVPLRIGRRPVVADASATHGVALASLPALGAVQLRRRARDAIVRLVDGLMGESLEVGRREAGTRAPSRGSPAGRARPGRAARRARRRRRRHAPGGGRPARQPAPPRRDGARQPSVAADRPALAGTGRGRRRGRLRARHVGRLAPGRCPRRAQPRRAHRGLARRDRRVPRSSPTACGSGRRTGSDASRRSSSTWPPR